MNSLSLPAQSKQIWVQAIGRGLYQLGSAILLFYMPIVFVNYGDLSATQVGLASGGGAISGFVGNLLGGSMTDSQRFGRKGTLVISTILAMIAAVGIAFSHTFTSLLAANLFFGISTGLYWTSADAAVMDATLPEQRRSAFSILGVADNLGFGAGTLGGGLLLTRLNPKMLIFAAAAVVFALMILLVLVAVTDQRSMSESPALETGWKQALTDSRLMTYLLVNTLFITYIAFVGSNLPLYFVNFGKTPDVLVSNLFTWGYVGLGALLQVPIIQLTTRLSYLRSLMVSMAIWGLGFALIWAVGGVSTISPWAELGIFGVFAIATLIYKPTSSSWIAELAPESIRGIYTAIAYQCWSIGYLIGPVLGGWALDQPPTTTRFFWLGVAASTALGLLILQVLHGKKATEATTEAANLAELT